MTTSADPSAAPLVTVNLQEGWAELTLDRPHRRNAVTPRLATELAAAVAAADDDPQTRAIVIAGAGDAFCSGLDIAALEDGDAAARLRAAWREVHATLLARRTPVIVALERYAINAGASLVLAADLVTAGDDAFVQTTEVTMGMAAPMCQFWLNRRRLTATAPRLVLLGDRVEAAELVPSGIVTSIVPAGDARAAAVAYGRRLAEHPPDGVAAVQDVHARLENRPSDRATAARALDETVGNGERVRS